MLLSCGLRAPQLRKRARPCSISGVVPKLYYIILYIYIENFGTNISREFRNMVEISSSYRLRIRIVDAIGFKVKGMKN